MKDWAHTLGAPLTEELLAQKARRERLLTLIDRHDDNEFISARAEEFLESIHRYYAWPAVRLEQPLSWDEDPFQDPSWNWRLHVMKSVFYLAKTYENEGSIRYLRRAEELVLSWINKNGGSETELPSPHSWGEHSTPLRLIHWLYFLEVWKSSELFQADKQAIFARALAEHGVRLADAKFYIERHNHGVDQDTALLALSYLHPGLVFSTGLIELCLDRLRKQLHFLVSANGVHLEHSPSYQLVGMIQLIRLWVFLSSWRPEEPMVDKLYRTLESMAEFLQHVLRPDGRLVMMGDSTFECLSDYWSLLAPGLEGIPKIKNIVSSGELASNADVAELYREEGYMVIRDFDHRKLPFDKSLHLFFTAAANEGNDHGHADALSFVLHDSGRDILIDHGYYSYRQDTGRDYFVGVASHNTVMVDGVCYHGYDSRIDNFVADPDYTLLRATHRNYPCLEHTRWLVHMRPDLVIVVDQLNSRSDEINAQQSAKDHTFEQLFHLAHDLGTQVRSPSGDSIEVSITCGNAGRILTLTQMGCHVEPVSLRIAKGEENPMMGWTSNKHAELVPSPVIITRQNGPEALFISLLDLSGVRHSWRVSNKSKKMHLGWREGESYCTLALDLTNDKVQATRPDAPE